MLYVDPAAGSIILQVAFAALLGGALTAKRWWGTLKQAVRTRMNRFRPE
ncbi:MAG: hypothetical protein ACREA0_08490 [bacterium]